MKHFLIFLLVGAMMASCAKDEEQSSRGLTTPGVVNVQILVNKTSSRAIEDNHNDVDEVLPTIFSVTLIAYNDGGVEISRIDLSQDQIKTAVWGSYKTSDGQTGAQITKPDAGASIGVPAGTHSVDVVINHPAEYKDDPTNINFFNYRYNRNGDNNVYQFGKDNFQRAQLNSDDADTKGIVLGPGNSVPGSSTDVPSFKVDFRMRPALSRIEVTGAINVDLSKIWIDDWGNRWSTMSVTDYELANPGITPDESGTYSPRGDVKGTGPLTEGGNDFDPNTVYVSEYYFYLNGTVTEKEKRLPGNSVDTEGDAPANTAVWVKNPQFTEGTILSWLPNRYYAVDVESIFVNNIKVRSSTRSPYPQAWPHDKADVFWLPWYQAYHTDGWHVNGTSDENTFLCMGNMWDLTADAAEEDKARISFPAVNGKSDMFVIDGKALAVPEKSEYYDKDGVGRNLGILKGKASAYLIYPQTKKDGTLSSNKAQLANELPHVIVKIKAYDNAEDYKDGVYVHGKEFITIKLFSDAANGGGNILTSFARGYIYRMNLDNLRYLFVGSAPVPGGKNPGGEGPTDPVDPDPEKPQAEVIMNVEVLPWKTKDIFPII